MMGRVVMMEKQEAASTVRVVVTRVEEVERSAEAGGEAEDGWEMYVVVHP